MSDQPGPRPAPRLVLEDGDMQLIRTHITWESFAALCAELAHRLGDFEPDVVVGISRGGLPVATVLAHHIGCRTVTSALAQKTVAEGAAGMNFGSSPQIGSIGPIPKGAQRLLVVDDIAAVGDVFTLIGAELRATAGEQAEIRFASLFCDTDRMADGPYSDVLKALTWGAKVDNVSEWIVFPWERDA